MSDKSPAPWICFCGQKNYTKYCERADQHRQIEIGLRKLM